MKRKEEGWGGGGGGAVTPPSPYIGSGCVANEMDQSEDMLLIQ